MKLTVEQSRKMLQKMPKEKLLDLFFTHVRNLWRIDGLYFLGIESKFGTEAATQIDMDCWKVMGKLEARELKNILHIRKNDVPSLMHALQNTGWSLYQEENEVETSPTRGVFRVTKCRTQEARIHKELGEFPCKNVRLSYLKSFTAEFNPDIEVKCQVCPPGKHARNVWCEWEFTLKKRT